jgi:hypothetical protein
MTLGTTMTTAQASDRGQPGRGVPLALVASAWGDAGSK